MKFSRATMILLLEAHLTSAIHIYKSAANKDYDRNNGHAQVPVGNEQAFLHYGRINAIKAILSEVKK